MRRSGLLALLLCAPLLALGCASGTPGACRPGINECVSRCPQGGSNDIRQPPPPTTQNSESPCERACRTQYCR